MNRLANETSPYLLQHADNPVDWYPWGELALEKARRENKPIFLSIGYATCYWCHVMEKESFEDPEVAAVLNRHFVAIKVDREERPDLDQLYMRAFQRMSGGAGGWPLSLFLTPEGEPFYGGTYFPRVPRAGLPGLVEVLQAVAQAWATRPDELRAAARRVAEGLGSGFGVAAEGAFEAALHDDALTALEAWFDRDHGGFGAAPKFPQAPVLAYLLARAWLGEASARGMLTATLRAMAEGGLFDQLGGGFHRYSTDPFWRVPHFEKMLYDNAQLARVYLGAHALTGEPAFCRVAEATLDFLLREMRGEEGGFYSALDAGGPGEEGAYYVWTWDDWQAALGDDAEAAARAYGVRREGNWEEGRNVLLRQGPAEPAWREKLLAARARRPRPATDDKVLADWNGLLLWALADAGRWLGREDCLEAARALARFLLGTMQKDGLVRHAWRAGRLREEAFLADQAAAGLGLLALHWATGEGAPLRAAAALAEATMRFFDPEAGRFVDGLAATPLGRPADPTDGALPSGTALAIEFLLRAGALFGREDWDRAARRAAKALEPAMARSPLAFGANLAAHLFGLLGSELAVAYPAPALWAEVRRGFFPLTAVAAGPPGAVPILAGRAPGRAYLCRAGLCRLPVEDADGLAREFLALYPSRAGKASAFSGF